ncbi:nectin-2-like [Thalassophryne amazonica]|uniref:nectin-2-like n=1 Tax=Thalassophryne amazonica TaxID=390379 RepID=UPI001470B25C|nr:nectin-2-like [Thalassophryne amazonica]
MRLDSGGSVGAIVGGILGALVVIGIIISIIIFIRKRQEDFEGPPKHKPPPPVKAGSSTEMLNKPSEPPTATEMVPLTPVYYETTGGEPITNLDDDTSGALNGGAPPILDDNVNDLKDHAADEGHRGNDLDSSNHDLPPANIGRGESFVSPAMYV